MTRFLVAGWLGVWLLCGAAPARAQDSIIPQSTAQRHGLTRAWYNHIELDQSVDRIAYITQYKGMLYVQTDHAMVHALDAESGRKLWGVQIGSHKQISLAPGVNDEYLGVINGSTLYVVDRTNGKLKFEKVLQGGPGAGPALSKTYIFVGMVNGMVEGYNLRSWKELPWLYHSPGRILAQPAITEGSIAWTTNKGYFYVCDAIEPKSRFRVHTQAEITSRPAHWTPFLYACSLDGFVYAVNEVTEQTAWKFSSGDPITKQPVAVNERVYVLPGGGGMYCLHGTTGEELWFASGLTNFLSVSPTHVYGVDQLNRLVILDARTGGRLDAMPLGETKFKLMNGETDRIYLASDKGIVQCLHETELAKPEIYAPPPLPKKDAPKASKQKGLDESVEEGAGDAEGGDEPPAKKPTMGDDAPAEEDDNPFG